MYYVFNTAITYYRSQFNSAQTVIDSAQYSLPWFYDIPIADKMPPLVFSFNTKLPKLDNLFALTEFSLYSSRLIDLLEQAGVRFEAFPITGLDRKTKQPIETTYKAFHLLDVHPGINQSQSIISDDIRIVEKIVLTEECLKAARPFFRLKELLYIVLIHEDLKATFDRMKITGCTYTPLEEFQFGI